MTTWLFVHVCVYVHMYVRHIGCRLLTLVGNERMIMSIFAYGCYSLAEVNALGIMFCLETEGRVGCSGSHNIPLPLAHLSTVPGWVGRLGALMVRMTRLAFGVAR